MNYRILSFLKNFFLVPVFFPLLTLANEADSGQGESVRSLEYESFTSFPGVGRISSLCQLIDALWQLGYVVLIVSVFIRDRVRGDYVYNGWCECEQCASC